MEWSNENALLLIQEYQKRDVLWNPKNLLHFHKIKKMDAWNEIASACGVDVGEAKKKIASLLGSFRREKMKRKASIGTGKGTHEIYKSNWFAFKSFSFLMDKDNPRLTINSEDGKNSDKYIAQEENSEQENFAQLDIQSIEKVPQTCTPEHESGMINFAKPSTPKPKRYRKRTSQEDPRIEHAYQFLQESIKEDSTMIYAKYIANKLKQFQGKTRTLVERAINEVIFKAEMGEYDLKGTESYISVSSVQHQQLKGAASCSYSDESSS